ncbi:MAG TPA: DUF1761 domain-containing protein [Spirochaetia bacterium]|nr:DUF1761 domain-containing protein [Spirochaetia bacterium]
MSFASVNWLAVLACVVFSMVSGSLWFGPKTFFPAWWKAIGKEGQEPKGTPITWILLIASSAVQAIVLALVVMGLGRASGGPTLVSGLIAGLVVWAGFVAATGLTNKLFAGQLKAWMFEAGNHLVNFAVFGIILGVWH